MARRFVPPSSALVLATACLLLFAPPTASAQQPPRPLRPGDILVNEDPMDGGRATFLVDPITLQKTPFSSYFEAPNAVELDPNGTVLTVDGFFRKLYRYDRNGQVLRTYDGVGPASDLAVEPGGGILFSRYAGGLFRLNPDSGGVGQLTNANILTVAVAPDGRIYTGTREGGGPGGIYRFNPDGTFTSVTTGGFLANPSAMEFDARGDLIIADAGRDTVVRYDLTSGQQTLITTGGILGTPRMLAIEPGGTILIGSNPTDGATDQLIRVDPVTGAQTFLLELNGAVDLAVVPAPEPGGLTLLGSAGLLALRRRAR